MAKALDVFKTNAARVAGLREAQEEQERGQRNGAARNCTTWLTGSSNRSSESWTASPPPPANSPSRPAC